MTDKVKKNKESKKEKAIEVKTSVAKLLVNVKHDGTFYKKDSECPKQLTELFKKKGFIA